MKRIATLTLGVLLTATASAVGLTGSYGYKLIVRSEWGVVMTDDDPVSEYYTVEAFGEDGRKINSTVKDVDIATTGCNCVFTVAVGGGANDARIGEQLTLVVTDSIYGFETYRSATALPPVGGAFGFSPLPVGAFYSDESDVDYGYDLWQYLVESITGIPLGEPDDDADGDGLTNLKEYRQGTSPVGLNEDLQLLSDNLGFSLDEKANYLEVQIGAAQGYHVYSVRKIMEDEEVELELFDDEDDFGDPSKAKKFISNTGKYYFPKPTNDCCRIALAVDGRVQCETRFFANAPSLDVTFAYDGLGHTIDTNLLFAITTNRYVGAESPSFTYSNANTKKAVYTAAPPLYTNVTTKAVYVYYKIAGIPNVDTNKAFRAQVTISDALAALKIPALAADAGYTYAVSNATTGARLTGVLENGTNTYAVAKGDSVKVYFTLAEGYEWDGEVDNPKVLDVIDENGMVVDEASLPKAKNSTVMVIPSEELAVPSGKTVEQFVDDLNTNDAVKAQYLKAPGEVETTGDYRGCFNAVPAGDGKVTFMLNADGTNAVATAQYEGSTNILATVLAATKTGENAATLVIATPLKGFYYRLLQQEQLTDAEAKVEEKLAGEEDGASLSFDLWKWPASSFYQLLVSPIPVERDKLTIPEA